MCFSRECWLDLLCLHCFCPKVVHFNGLLAGNLYGTALCSVRDAKNRGTPLITPHPLALQLLRTSEFMPFIIFVQPPDKAAFKVCETTDTDAVKISKHLRFSYRRFASICWFGRVFFSVVFLPSCIYSLPA